MKSTLARITCRILVASMIALPFQAQAGMIGTDLSAAGTAIDREQVVSQLQTLGISRQAAQERIAALTDRELASLAGHIDQLPAGGVAGLLPIIAAAVLIWWFTIGEKEQAQGAKGKK
jgi:hypothetical protein